MTSWEQFDEMFNITSGAKGDATCSHHLGTNNTENQIITQEIELTINLRKTIYFDDTKEAYLRLYNKILDYVKIYVSSKISHTFVFEYGKKNNKLHLHASIIIYDLPKVYNRWGLVEMIAVKLCQLTRRKYSSKNMYTEYPRYQSIPFTLQCNDRHEYWEQYMNKGIKIIDAGLNALKNCV